MKPKKPDAAAPFLASIEVAKIDPDRAQPRKEFDAEAMAELGQSLKLKQLVPVTVRASKGGRFILVDGERRWRAAKEHGLKTLHAVVVSEGMGDPATVLADQVAANQAREALKPLELAEAIQALEAAGWSRHKIGDHIGLSQSALCKAVSLTRLAPRAREYVVSGQISPASGYEISRLPEHLQDDFAQLTLADNWSRVQVAFEVSRKLSAENGRDLPGQAKCFFAREEVISDQTSRPDEDRREAPERSEKAPPRRWKPGPPLPSGPGLMPSRYFDDETARVNYVAADGRFHLQYGPIELCLRLGRQIKPQGLEPFDPLSCLTNVLEVLRYLLVEGYSLTQARGERKLARGEVVAEIGSSESTEYQVLRDFELVKDSDILAGRPDRLLPCRLDEARIWVPIGPAKFSEHPIFAVKKWAGTKRQEAEEFLLARDLTEAKQKAEDVFAYAAPLELRQVWAPPTGEAEIAPAPRGHVFAVEVKEGKHWQARHHVRSTRCNAEYVRWLVSQRWRDLKAYRVRPVDVVPDVSKVIDLQDAAPALEVARA